MSDVRWLAVHRHRVRGFRALFVLNIQHHLVDSATRIVAPLVPAAGDAWTLLAPKVQMAGVAYRVMLLDLSTVPVRLLADQVKEVIVHEDPIGAALDAIFRGYPVGLPLVR